MSPDDQAAYRTGPLPVISAVPRADPVSSARMRSRLSGDARHHIQRLLASWHILSDFCFSDLLLFVPMDESDGKFVVIGQVRPSTSQTLYRSDLIGREVTDVERPLVCRSYSLGEIIEGEHLVEPMREPARVVCIPVRHNGEVIGVLSRETPLAVGRHPGELERVYAEIFNHFAQMIAAGSYPFVEADSDSDELPRVGDGVLLLDREMRVTYASPNAVSALHRVSVHANTEGMRLGQLGFEDEEIRNAYEIRRPVTYEIEWAGEVTVLVHCIPLISQDAVTAAVVLSRDISELRRRDRLLLSKDATIREIHHRVKNNLQTVSALLRLQGRRLASEEARSAIDESVRRVRSIALVHDMLSRDTGDEMPFIDIINPLVHIVEDGLVAPEQPVKFAVTGDHTIAPSEVVTPLAVVLNELLQNAVDHAFPDRTVGGEVTVRVSGASDQLIVEVVDDGVGLPEGFDFATASGLGLSIVRALVVSDLRGTITAGRPEGADRGTVISLAIPLRPR